MVTMLQSAADAVIFTLMSSQRRQSTNIGITPRSVSSRTLEGSRKQTLQMAAAAVARCLGSSTPRSTTMPASFFGFFRISSRTSSFFVVPACLRTEPASMRSVVEGGRRRGVLCLLSSVCPACNAATGPAATGAPLAGSGMPSPAAGKRTGDSAGAAAALTSGLCVSCAGISSPAFASNGAAGVAEGAAEGAAAGAMPRSSSPLAGSPSTLAGGAAKGSATPPMADAGLAGFLGAVSSSLSSPSHASSSSASRAIRLVAVARAKVSISMSSALSRASNICS
mmetsp:Transcript_13494/g.29111  ORF Transcript_13494/g.29111 Transcript_13494/m.29111 type:complete len:281 (-) Transcript_13494:393-1235(-)